MDLMSWKEVCKPQKLGGFGIRKMREFNYFVLVKQLWRLLFENSEWVWILSSKYLRGMDKFRDVFLANFIPPSSSTLWNFMI